MKYDRMAGWGLIRVKEKEESSSELVPLAEAGKTTDWGQDGDEALVQWDGNGSRHSNKNVRVVSVYTQKLCLGTTWGSHL